MTRWTGWAAVAALAACTTQTEPLSIAEDAAIDAPDLAGPQVAPADRVAPPPGTLAIEASGGVVGGTVTLNTSGAALYERVYLARSFAGASSGAGPCLAAFGGSCMDLALPVGYQGELWSDVSGNGTLTVSVPLNPVWNGQTACFQAIVQRGPGGIYTELSDTVCLPLGFDGDSDGVIDSEDACIGFDDMADADGDGIPDGCDTPVSGGAFGDWLVGTPPNGFTSGGWVATAAETGYHYQGEFTNSAGTDVVCWWHTKNQAWNVDTSSNYFALAAEFGLAANPGGSNWCHPEGLADPCATTSACDLNGPTNYFDPTHIGAFGWCGQPAFDSGGYVCFEAP